MSIHLVTPQRTGFPGSSEPMDSAGELYAPFAADAASALGHFAEDFTRNTSEFVGGSGTGNFGTGSKSTQLSGCGGPCSHSGGPHCAGGLQCRNGTCSGGGCGGGGLGGGGGGGGLGDGGGGTAGTPSLSDLLALEKSNPNLLSGLPATSTLAGSGSGGPNFLVIGIAAIVGLVAYFWWKHHKAQGSGSQPPPRA